MLDAEFGETVTAMQGLFWAASILFAAVLIGLLVHAIGFGIAKTLTRKRPTLRYLEGNLMQAIEPPFRLILPIIAARSALPVASVYMTPAVTVLLANVLFLVLVGSVAWMFIRLTAVFTYVVSRKFDVTVADNLEARKFVTQASIIRRVAIFVIVLLAVATALMRFEDFHRLGAGLLASAGIAGLVIGFAAQRALGNLLAGIQIAITQPIRVDDVVVLEGEWGRIEEITLTYVVVRIWDLRRLILPISYFIETPFQNWTRSSADILGTAFFYVDYTVPVDAVRDELGRILEGSENFDGVVWRLHVTDISDRTVELRALMSSSDSGRAFELRCEVRERMLAFIRDNYPQSLPTFRMRALADGDTARKAA
jgi:small-conductance mechanosensitive channel